MTKPSPADKKALLNMTMSKEHCEKTIALKRKEFKLKVLLVQIYRDLVYRYSADESWQFNTAQVTGRKALFYKYKNLANKYYDELALLDKKIAYDYLKLKMTNNYPL